jgi:4-hydroxy-2-oxoheptanedioate aldolase
MVQFGPSDYSQSMGIARGSNPDQVREAEKYVVETAHKRGIPARAEIRDADGARHYVEMGIRHFCVGWDVRVLHDWLTDNGKRMRDILADSGAVVPEPVEALAGKPQTGY